MSVFTRGTNIIVQAGSDISVVQAVDAADRAVAAASGISTPYPTRAAFLGAQIAPVVTRSSFFAGGNTYSVVRDVSGPIVQANGQRWRPDGVVTPQHFGAVGDGVADDTAAVQAAVDYGWLVYMREGTYIVSGPGVFARDGGRIYGDGRTKTILKKKANVGSTDELDPILRERSVGGVSLPVRDLTVEHIGFEGNGSSEIQTDKGAGLFRCYESYNVRFRGCSFYRSRGYGVGMQGTNASPEENRRGPHVDTLFDDCEFYENGKAEYLTGSDSEDGIDFKSSERATLINCRAWDNGDKGFDLKGRSLTVIGCHSWENAGVGFAQGIEGVQPSVTAIDPSEGTFTNCWSWGNGSSGFSVVPQVTTGVVGGRIYSNFVGCQAWNNSHNFNLASRGTNDLAVAHVALQACVSRNPVAGTRHFLGSDAAETITITGGIYVGGTTIGLSAHSSQVGPFNINGATLESIGGTAIAGSSQAAARTNINGNVFRNIGSAVFTGHSNTTISGNTYEAVTAAARFSFSGTNNRVLDKEQGLRSVSSAATLTLPEITDIFAIVGTTNITNITASWAGRVVTLRFTTVLDVVDGGNLRLAGTLTTASNTMLTLISDGTNWYETSRSVN